MVPAATSPSGESPVHPGTSTIGSFRSGRSPGLGIVLAPRLPVRLSGQWPVRHSSPLTVAGQRGLLTPFPLGPENLGDLIVVRLYSAVVPESSLPASSSERRRENGRLLRCSGVASRDREGKALRHVGANRAGPRRPADEQPARAAADARRLPRSNRAARAGRDRSTARLVAARAPPCRCRPAHRSGRS